MGHCQVLTPLCPLQVETAVVGNQQGLPCGSIGTVTTGQEPLLLVLRPALILYKLLLCTIKAQAPMKQSCWTILSKAQSWRGVVFRGAPVDLSGTKVPVTACLWRMRLMVAGVRPTRPAIEFCCMLSRASASTCMILISVGRSIIRIISENWEKKYAIVDSSCGFGLWRSNLAFEWESGQGKVRFRWGTFHVNFSPLEAQKVDPYLFYCPKRGVTIFFPRV